MARIAGVNIPNHQHIVIGLTAIYGIGRPRAQDICAIAGVAPTKKVKDLDDSELEKLRAEIVKWQLNMVSRIWKSRSRGRDQAVNLLFAL